MNHFIKRTMLNVQGVIRKRGLHCHITLCESQGLKGGAPHPTCQVTDASTSVAVWLC